MPMPSLALLLLLSHFLTRSVWSAPALGTLDGIAAVPAFPGVRICTSLRVRKEWRTLTVDEQQDYIGAARCVSTSPARDPSDPNVQTRFDELQATHISRAEDVHTVGQFLPWHRQYSFIYEQLLRVECGYQGPLPYWNWSIDADSGKPFVESPVFDSVNGFGGNGVPGTYTLPSNFAEYPSRVPIDPRSWRGCVEDGAFSSDSYSTNLGPGKMISPHCLVRGINDTYRLYLTSEAVNTALALDTFEEFRIELEGRPYTKVPKMHDAVHGLVGGDMTNFYSSVADPLFFLHHTAIDRIWWTWQMADPANRMYQVSGRSTVNPPYRNVTLDDYLDYEEFSPKVHIRDVMNTIAEPLCYAYDV